MNDTRKLSVIYKALVYYILANKGGSQNIPKIAQQDCIGSPTTRTIYVMKKAGGAHLKSNIRHFTLEATPLESMWNNLSQNILPHFLSKQSLKLILKLLLHNIYEIKHLTLPNGTNQMSCSEFKIYYTRPTKLSNQALHIADQLFCLRT